MLNLWGRRGLAVALGLLSFVSAAPASAAATTSVVASEAAVVRAATVMSNAINTVSGSLLTAPAAMATEAAWLFRSGWPLYALVDRYATNEVMDEQMTCLATAVYFEARGESLEGQLAVAKVVMNRAASGKYPSTWCATVKQPWQFSFVRNGVFPRVDTASTAWRRAQAIARLATANVVPSLSDDVLWYHADYVAPSWGRRLERVEKIGTHIFYRS